MEFWKELRRKENMSKISVKLTIAFMKREGRKLVCYTWRTVQGDKVGNSVDFNRIQDSYRSISEEIERLDGEGGGGVLNSKWDLEKEGGQLSM
jgi:hypothetical protein